MVRKCSCIVHGNEVQDVTVSNVGGPPHDAYFFCLVAFQLRGSLSTTASELAIEQLHESLHPVSAAQVFCENVRWIYFPTDFPELYGLAAHLFLHPKGVCVAMCRNLSRPCLAHMPIAALLSVHTRTGSSMPKYRMMLCWPRAAPDAFTTP